MTKRWRFTRNPHAVAALVLAFGIMMATVAAARAAANELPWDRVAAGGHVILLRHAIAPGTGDPPDFELGECSTQRNINDAGREQAERIGQRLRQAGLDGAPVFTSQWCRCQQTASELGLGKPQLLEALNSFYGRWAEREQRVQALTAFLAERHEGPTAILVTHQVNITAVTDIFPESGEAIVADIHGDGSLEVVGTMTTSPPSQ
jgi:broad specificity phosphatase PhoE